MFSKSILSVAAVAALGLSANAFAQVTTADSAGTIFVNVDVTGGTAGNAGAAYLFDTGLSTSSFTGTQSYSWNLATDSNFEAFLTSVTGSSTGSLNGGTANYIEYSVLGGYSNGTAYKLDYASTTTSTGGTESSGSTQDAIVNDVAPFLQTVQNPKGGSSWISAAADAVLSGANSWYQSGSEAYLKSTDTSVTGSTSAGTKLYFDQLSSSSGNETPTTFAGTWLLTSAGMLTYTTSAVPLPAPLVLLLSGLGLMGLIARRGQGGFGRSVEGTPA
jgi:hypothetical protein